VESVLIANGDGGNTSGGPTGDDGDGGEDEADGFATSTRGCACAMSSTAPLSFIAAPLVLVLRRRRR
jgi:uncharacterized protein (TIGR03382 family)